MTWGDPVTQGLPGERQLTKLLMLVQNIGGGGQSSMVIRLLGWKQNTVVKRFLGKILPGKVLLVQRSLGENVLSRFLAWSR